MNFFSVLPSSIGSSIGRKLLLFGLRQIDLLDKDPSDFVSVDVGKKTTLEVRDVGLHVKLPPEIRISKARVSLLRVTFILEFGVPQIIIDIDGIQLHAQIVENEDTAEVKPRGKEPQPPRSSARPRSPHRRPADSTSEYSSEDDDEHIPSVDDLAQSFIREESAEEIRELEEALHNESAYLHESVSEYGDDESVAGVGTPLGLPGILRNMLNTALDRLRITANHIDIQLEDQIPSDPSQSPLDDEGVDVSLNLHVDQVSIDSVTAPEPNVEVTGSRTAESTPSRVGKRRMRIENVCARLFSDVESFATFSRISRSLSPVDARSEVSSSRKSQSDVAASRTSVDYPEPTAEPQAQEGITLEHQVQEPTTPELQQSTHSDDLLSQSLTSPHLIHPSASIHSAHRDGLPSQHSSRLEQPNTPTANEPEKLEPLAASTHTVDEDRFADAASDDGLDNHPISDSTFGLRDLHLPQDMGGSSILYDNEGLVEYALDNLMFDSEHGGSLHNLPRTRLADIADSEHSLPVDESLQSSADIPPTVSALLQQSWISRQSEQPSPRPEQSMTVDSIESPAPADVPSSSPHQRMSQSIDSVPAESAEGEQSLSESTLFTHDDAESMYMSAMSEAPISSHRGPTVPGGWDSVSNSSQGTASETSTPIPADMTAGSILVPDVANVMDDGCQTPRPGSRQSEGTPTQGQSRQQSPESRQMRLRQKLSKLFFTVDEITIWFPLRLESDQGGEVEVEDSAAEEKGFSFSRPDLGTDSIFQDMPGSFSNYAHSTSRRNPSIDLGASFRNKPDAKRSVPPISPKPTKYEPTISVEVGSVIGHLDFSTGRIIYQMAQRFIALIGTAPSDKDHKQSVDVGDTAKTPSPSLTLSVKNIGIAWVKNLMTESLVESPTRAQLQLDPSNAILNLGLSSIEASTQTQPNQSRLRLLIGTFIISSMGHDILSFRKPRPRSRRSAPNNAEGPQSDIEIVYEQGSEKRITVVTRPVKIDFDMQQVDDALGSFGGFSGILEMGSSMSSANTVHSPMSPSAPSKPRGVHFGDAPSNPPPSTSPSPAAPKIDIRIEEVLFMLRGQSCAVQIKTTSVKAAVRASNVRLKVSEVEISGPYTADFNSGSPLVLNIKDTTVDFRFTPDETDLTRLISMITPSKDPYENDDDIMIDTLLRQRRKGSVVRAQVATVGLRISDISAMGAFEALGAEVARLSRVTKYLPDDDRPGILTLATVHDFEARAVVNEKLGDILLSLQDASIAHVGMPSLFAIEIAKTSIHRKDEILVHEVATLPPQDRLPMIMARVVGDEMEPVVKVKLFNVCAEYHVTTVMAALGISENGTTDDIALGLASSVATITGVSQPKKLSRQTSEASSPSSANNKPFHIDLLLRSCALGLNPRKIPSKGLFVLTNAHFLGKQSKETDYSITVELREASIHAIDDVGRIEEQDFSLARTNAPPRVNSQLHELQRQGFVSLSVISAASVLVDISGDDQDQPRVVDIEFKNKLFVVEACADSTQTLIAILNGLQPPIPPSTAQQYRTVVPLQQMMESFTGDAFDAAELPEEENFMDNADLVTDEVPANLEFVGSFYNQESLPSEEDLGDSMLDEDDLEALATAPVVRQRGDKRLLESFQEQYEVAEGENDFEFEENYFQDSDSEHKGNARKWDSAKNRYHLTNEFKTPDAPLKVRVRDLNIILNLFDGYDWPRTRAILTEAVETLENRAEEKRHRPREDDEDEFEVEQDFLFNSVWIGVPIRDEKGALTRRINHDIDDLASETGSIATSTATRSTGATARPRTSNKSSSRRRLKLDRSKHKKIAFELTGIAVDLIVFPSNSGETQNSLDVRIQDFEIFDHVPSSTWKKFVTGLIDPSQREMGRPLIRLELQTVKPVTDLAASELVIKVTVSPLRLHVDQDALDFITRFFEFKDDTAPETSTPSEQPFIQRLEVMAVTLKLDYKPKRVDYGGLRSGHTTEFMNFLILDGSDIVLRHAIVYGITSFDKLHKTLNDVWMPDVKRNQLPGVLSGLAAVRPIVNVGSGVRDLVVVPMREYKKDGRIVRSLQKGVYAFAKNTTSEAARLGARVAIGAQTLLEGAENFLNPQSPSTRPLSGLHDWDDLDPADGGEDEPRAVSNYANQPIGVKAGLRSAARYLERDLLTARDAVIAIPAEVMEEGSGVGMAKAIARRAPTVILRPALGATKAIGNTLLGVGNALDKDSKRKIDDKYKSY
ncbi:hypothetical protein BU24DRAFT_407841 [Aaosphaeria arxii CBS 175.79]|uniref:Autophagy-related protein 2 n=1 Tax=Aaosphaeria arxii CBS 175.79 TaxID=1450172 RepID=A0A6A5XZZ1_9PLEO|nr:uncharacterized protein BU24DRAFT_407841 [Aaosphaeria arxii CBS 175.79]KAF2017874.1 hypothetical protein BU24DRAFT_407841 [Aaosphaeria arxii CBS 175.79]